MSAPILVPTPPAWARELFTVGITGTNGKSTTTTWIAAALAARNAPDERGNSPVVRATTLGFFVGDEELALERSYDGFLECMRLGYERGARFAAIELTSEALARGFAKAWPCRVGVFTNLSHDHLDAHGSPEHYLASKAQLFVSLEAGGIAVLNARDEACALLAAVLPAGVRCVTYGVPSRGEACLDEDVVVSSVAIDWNGTTVECKIQGTAVSLSVRAIGEVHAENALAAWLGAEAAGIPRKDVLARLGRAPAPPGRFEVVSDVPHVVVDYAHTPDALARTLATARTLASRVQGARVYVVFGAGGNRDRAKRQPMGEAAREADVVLLTSDNPRGEDPKEIARAIALGLVGHPDVRTVLDRAHAIRAVISEARDEDVIVLCGMGHEREQIVGTRRIAFSDVDVAKEAVAARPRT